MTGFLAHLKQARTAAEGAVPRVASRTISRQRSRSPAWRGLPNAALRALARGTAYTKDLADLRIRDAACRVAWGFRSLFNRPGSDVDGPRDTRKREHLLAADPRVLPRGQPPGRARRVRPCPPGLARQLAARCLSTARTTLRAGCTPHWRSGPLATAMTPSQPLMARSRCKTDRMRSRFALRFGVNDSAMRKAPSSESARFGRPSTRPSGRSCS